MSIYQKPPILGFTPEELAQSKAPQIYIALGIVTVIATVGVILRFVSRKKSNTALSYDDYTIVLALVFLYTLNTLSVVNAALYGVGRHLPAVDPAVIPSFQKVSLAHLAMYFTTSALIKASLLLLYYRCFGVSRPFRIALYISAVVIVCWYLAVFFATIFQCVPVAAFWDRNIKNKRCVNLSRFSTDAGVTNLLTDFMILCLPMPMVWTLHTNRTQKVTLTGIFLLGFFVCAASVARAVTASKVNGLDVTWGIHDVVIWTSTEPAIGILSACLPTMRPLFGRLLKLPTRTALTPKLQSIGTKKPILATESTTTPATRQQDWIFNKLDEEAVAPDPLHRNPVVNTEMWGNKPESVELEYEMDSLENKPLAGRPQKGKRMDLRKL